MFKVGDRVRAKASATARQLCEGGASQEYSIPGAEFIVTRIQRFGSEDNYFRSTYDGVQCNWTLCDLFELVPDTAKDPLNKLLADLRKLRDICKQNPANIQLELYKGYTNVIESILTSPEYILFQVEKARIEQELNKVWPFSGRDTIDKDKILKATTREEVVALLSEAMIKQLRVRIPTGTIEQDGLDYIIEALRREGLKLKDASRIANLFKVVPAENKVEITPLAA